MKFKIDNKVPIPLSRCVSYPFADMNIGDSFIINLGELHNTRSAASHFGKYNNMKFTIRKQKNAHRCWRIK